MEHNAYDLTSGRAGFPTLIAAAHNRQALYNARLARVEANKYSNEDGRGAILHESAQRLEETSHKKERQSSQNDWFR